MQYIESFDTHTIYIGEHEIPIGEVYRNDFLTNILADLLPETDNNCLIRGITAIKK